MSHLVKLIQSFSKDESGAALVEYAVIFAILIAGTVGVLTTITTPLQDIFEAVETQLGTIVTSILP